MSSHKLLALAALALLAGTAWAQDEVAVRFPSQIAEIAAVGTARGSWRCCRRLWQPGSPLEAEPPLINCLLALFMGAESARCLFAVRPCRTERSTEPAQGRAGQPQQLHCRGCRPERQAAGGGCALCQPRVHVSKHGGPNSPAAAELGAARPGAEGSTLQLRVPLLTPASLGAAQLRPAPRRRRPPWPPMPPP